MKRRRPEEAVLARMQDLAVRFRWGVVMRGVRASAFLLLLLVTGSLYVDSLLEPPAVFLLAMVGVAAGVECAFLLVRVVLPAWRRFDPVDLARRLERRIPAFSGRLVAAVERATTPSDPRRGYSEALQGAAFERAVRLLGRTGDAVIRRRLGIREAGGSTAARVVAIACGVLLVGGFLPEVPMSLRRAAGRLAHPLALYRAERTWDLEVEPGDASRMQGESLIVRVRSPRGERGLEPCIRTVAPDGEAQARPMAPGAGGAFEARFEELGSGFRYRVLEGRRRSPEYAVSVEAWPGITEMAFEVVPPSYTGLAPSRTSGVRGVIFAPAGSVVGISGRASKDLRGVEALFSRGRVAALPLIDSRGFRGEIHAVESDTVRVVPIDRTGHRGKGGRPFALRVVPDRAPEVRLLRPETDREVDRSLREILRFEADDDYGLRDLRVEYAVEGRGGEEKSAGTIRVAEFAPGRSDTVLEYAWDLRPLGLSPGDRVRFRGVLRDNDSIRGPKEGASDTRRLTLPTVAELFSRRREEIGASAEELAGAVEEAARLRRSIESLRREMEAGGGVDWAGRRAAGDLVRRQREALERLRAGAERFEKSADEMRRDGGISPELLRRVEEVSRLFEEVATPEMIAAMEALKEALDAVDPARLDRALADLNLSEETFRKGLEKTWRALRRLQAEQRLEALSRRAAEIRDRQESFNRRLEGGRTGTPAKARREEETIARDAEEFEASFATAPGEMRTVGAEETADELERLSGRMAMRDLPSEMRGIGAMIVGRGGKGTAVSKGREAAAGMEDVRRRVDGIREEMRRRWRRETARAIDGAIENLLALSRGEEALAAAAPSVGESGDGVDAFMEEQGVLTEGLEGVAADLLRSSEETYYIGREAGTRIGEALARMRRSARRLESSGRGDPLVAADAREAVRGLNGALLALMRDRDAMRGAESGVGLEEAFRRMMALARSQAALNEQTGGMFPLPMPGPGRSPGSELLRMAAEQRRIREGLEAVRKALEEEGGGLGRLDEVEREMEAVEGDLAAGTLRRESIERQRRILSRMLDAQKSLRRREEGGRRKARAPGPYRTVPPETLSAGATDTRDNGRLPGTGGVYPAGYVEAIRAYLGRLAGRTEDGGNE